MAVLELRGWSTEANPDKLYTTEIAATRADGRERLQALLDQCLVGYDCSIDIDDVLREADAFVSAIEDARA